MNQTCVLFLLTAAFAFGKPCPSQPPPHKTSTLVMLNERMSGLLIEHNPFRLSSLEVTLQNLRRTQPIRIAQNVPRCQPDDCWRIGERNCYRCNDQCDHTWIARPVWVRDHMEYEECDD